MNSLIGKLFVAWTLLLLTISSCSIYNLIHLESKNASVSENLSTDNFSEFNVSIYKNKINNQMKELISTSSIEMDVGCPEGTLGNFICDLTLFTTNQILNKEADFCILNNGGFRTSLPQGEITVGKIFEIMPFDNLLVILELNGNQMIELINYIKLKSMCNGSRKGGIPVSGLRASLLGSEISRVFIGIEEFNPKKKYKLVTTDYLANGGDGMEFLQNATLIESTNYLLRDAIIDYLKRLKKQNIQLDAELDGRIEISE